MTIKFGLNLRFLNPPAWRRPWVELYDDYIRIARVAEELGFDGVWVPEHHSVAVGYNPTPMLVLAAIARETTRLKLGTQPLLLPLHNPVIVAEETCVLDVLSHGRVILGLGAGYRLGDFTALGVEHAERKSYMDESCEILYKCFTEPEPFSFAGRHYRLRNVDVQPRSEQQPHPQIFMPVRSRAAARRAGRYGFSANLFIHTQDQHELYTAYVSALRESGHDPGACEIAAMGEGFFAATEEEARELTRPYYATGDSYAEWMNETGRADKADRLLLERRGRRRPPVTPEAYADTITETAAMFADSPVKLGWYNISPWVPGMETSVVQRALELFARRVMPAFRAAATTPVHRQPAAQPLS